MNELLNLVDEHDNVVGKLDKLSTHEKGLLHRAFSLFIFNGKGELLLQQRSDDKYHSAGLWSNTCCSHPGYGESVETAVARRLYEEMGMQCDAEFQFSFIYKSHFENGLTEHELDHVYFGSCDDIPCPNEKEVKSWRYIGLTNLQEEIETHPETFSSWIKISLPKVNEQFMQNLRIDKNIVL